MVMTDKTIEQKGQFKNTNNDLIGYTKCCILNGRLKV